MSVLIRGMEMPDGCVVCPFFIENRHDRGDDSLCRASRKEVKCGCPLVPVPPHGDLIDRDALIKDGWLNLHKEVMRMGGYAIHELPLKNPSIHVIIPAEEGET